MSNGQTDYFKPHIAPRDEIRTKSRLNSEAETGLRLFCFVLTYAVNIRTSIVQKGQSL